MLAGKVAGGEDPRAQIKDQARRERAVLSAALDEYEAWINNRRLVKARDTLSSLRRGLAHLAKRDLADLDRRALVHAIEAVERDGRPGAARDLRKNMMTFLERQVTLGVIPANPLAGFRMPAKTRDEKAAQEAAGRALTEGEVRSIWIAARDMGGPFAGLVRLAMATGLRRGELAAMQWDWIDRDARRITIPARFMKAGSEHIVPITSLVAAVLDEQPDRGGGLVFPSERRHGGATPLSGWSQLLTRLRTASDVDGVGLHDLRRTFRSALADLGVPEPLAEAMIAHKRPDLIARYNRGEQWTLRVEAADRFDAWLTAIVTRDEGAAAANIISLARKKKK